MVCTRMQDAPEHLRFVYFEGGRYNRYKKFEFFNYAGTLLTMRQVDDVLKRVKDLGLQGEVFSCHF